MSSSAVLPSVARRLLALAIAIPTALLAALLAPAAAHAADVETYRFKGIVVSGYEENFDGACVYSARAVNAGEDFAGEDFVMYFETTFNQCTGDASFIGGAATPTYFATRGANAAHLVATIPLHDPETGEFVRDLELDNVWTASGPAEKNRTTTTTMLPGSYRYSIRFSGTTAPATVSGTVSFDTHATIGKYSYHQTTITH